MGDSRSAGHLKKPGSCSLIKRVSSVARFDTIVFNPETKILEVWRYHTGRYVGKHKIILSMSNVRLTSSVRLTEKELVLFEQLALLVAKVASLCVISREYSLPTPWWGFRFC